MQGNSTGVRVLPVKAVQDAFSYLQRDRGYTKRILLLCGAVMSFLYVLEDAFGLNSTGTNFAGIVAESFFVYCWHRFVLLDDTNMTGKSWVPFLKRTLLYYIGLTLLFFSVFLLLTGLLQGAGELLLGLVMLATPIALLVIVPRIALVFPALAVESNKNRMRDAFDLSRGHVWPMAGAYFLIGLCIMLLMIPAFLIGVIAGAVGADASSFGLFDGILNLVAGLTAAVIAVLIAGLNSSIYQQLGGDIPQEPDLAAEADI